jgi:hypothetical protein
MLTPGDQLVHQSAHLGHLAVAFRPAAAGLGLEVVDQTVDRRAGWGGDLVVGAIPAEDDPDVVFGVDVVDDPGGHPGADLVGGFGGQFQPADPVTAPGGGDLDVFGGVAGLGVEAAQPAGRQKPRSEQQIQVEPARGLAP